MFDGILNHEASFFAGNYEFSGISSLEFSQRSSYNTENILGLSRGFTVPSGPQTQSLNLNRSLIYKDPILNYTGDSPMAASIFYNDNYYGFEKGYLNRYSLNCAVGSVPKSSATFSIFDEMKTGIDTALVGRSRIRHPQIDIPSQGSISITCDNSSTNRVIGFDYSIQMNRKAVYGIGQKDPYGVELIKPITYTASASIDVDDAFLEDSYSFLDSRENKNLSIIVNGRGGKEIQSVNIPNASLVGETLKISEKGTLRLDLNYVGHG